MSERQMSAIPRRHLRFEQETDLDHERLGDDAFEVDGIDEGLAKSDLLDARVVEAVNVVPDWIIQGWDEHRDLTRRPRESVRTVDLLVLVVLVLDGSEMQGNDVREDQAVGNLMRGQNSGSSVPFRLKRFLTMGDTYEVLVSSEKDGVEHGLVEEEVAHPLGDNDVDLLDGELNVLELALDDGNLYSIKNK
jgi:hypothetical protein